MNEETLKILEDFGFEKTADENVFKRLTYVTDSACIKMIVGFGLSSGKPGCYCELWLVDPNSPDEKNVWIGNPDGSCIELKGDADVNELLKMADGQIRSFSEILSGSTVFPVIE